MNDLDCRLPDGRLVGIEPEAADRLSCGLVVMTSVKVADNPAVGLATEALGRELATALADLLPGEIPALAEARTLYRSFGMDPSRHRPSSEALLRRVLQGKSLYRINNVVDACNLASLQFALPIGMYDLALVRGDVTLRTGTAGEEYAGIRKGTVHLDGRLGLFDETGPFGSPSSDSDRTCTSVDTTGILAVIMATASHDRARLEEFTAEFSRLFAAYCQGTEGFRAVLGGGA